MSPQEDVSDEGMDELINIIQNIESTDLGHDGSIVEGLVVGDEEEEEEEEEPVNKVKSAEGLKIIEEIMGGEGQVMDEGKFLELCNIFRDLHQQ